MARADRRLPDNVPGPLFVDESCIDCDTCRWMAPETFDRSAEQSRVHGQPQDPAHVDRALQALVACPTGSIGLERTRDGGATIPADALARATEAFPLPLTGPVHLCGYHHPDSFGAASYLILREAGNVLVDSPRFAGPLVRRLEQLGGVRWMLLTHRDDVGDHARFARHFACERVLHAADAHGDLRRVERLLDGKQPVALDDDLLVIPVPGHTRGSVCLLHEQRHLFTGDHLAWSPRLGRLHAFRRHCWYDWSEQIASMQRLVEHRFEWILPGHGRRTRLDADERGAALASLLDWMEAQA